MSKLELLVAGDRRLVGGYDPGIYIDAARVDRVVAREATYGGWGVPGRSQWVVEVMTREVQDLEADPPMLYTPTLYSFDYPDEATARRDAARIEAFIGLGLTGVEMIAAERQRQITAGWVAEHDDQHTHGELLLAALAYGVEAAPADAEFVTPAGERFVGGPARSMPQWWPWVEPMWNPPSDPVRNLTKAGALIAAELDRLARAAVNEPEDSDG